MSDCKWSWDFQKTHAFFPQTSLKAKMVYFAWQGLGNPKKIFVRLKVENPVGSEWISSIGHEPAFSASWILLKIYVYVFSQWQTTLPISYLQIVDITPFYGIVWDHVKNDPKWWESWMLHDVSDGSLKVRNSMILERLQHVVDDQQESHHLRNFKPRRHGQTSSEKTDLVMAEFLGNTWQATTRTGQWAFKTKSQYVKNKHVDALRSNIWDLIVVSQP